MEQGAEPTDAADPGQSSGAQAGRIRVRLFASLREIWGSALGELPLLEGGSVEGYWEELCRARTELRSWRGSVRPALNQRYVDWDQPVVADDELAFLPPVSGGSHDSSRGTLVTVSPAPIDLARLVAQLPLAGAGAIATFTGVVRDPDQGHRVEQLEYEAYPDMAEWEIAAIIEEALVHFQAGHALVQHRTGVVASAEASVAVVVSAAHRHQALDACAYIIDELKSRVPIWKIGS